MDELLAVQVAEDGERLIGDRQDLGLRQALARSADLRQVGAVDELHDDVGRALVADAEVVDLGDSRVTQPRRYLGLAQEPRLMLLLLPELRADHLDHPHLLQQPVADLVDRPHPALAHLLEDLVLAVDLVDAEPDLGHLSAPRRSATGGCGPARVEASLPSDYSERPVPAASGPARSRKPGAGPAARTQGPPSESPIEPGTRPKPPTTSAAR